MSPSQLTDSEQSMFGLPIHLWPRQNAWLRYMCAGIDGTPKRAESAQICRKFGSS
jgi:hypothetical protein